MISVAERQTSPPGVSLTKRQQKQQSRALFIQYRQTGDVRLRDELIQLHLGVARYVALKFAGRGESFEDLYQVGCIGLMKAVQRFDAERGCEFLTFAFPTITGEIQRYFRDSGWAIRVPRTIQSHSMACDKATETLTRQHGRSPTIAEIAALVGIAEEQVIESQEAWKSKTLASLDALQSTDRESSRLFNSFGCVDSNLDAVDERLFTADLLTCLSERESLLIDQRFKRQMSQRDIGRQIGVSQMQVSRLLERALAKLRAAYGKITGVELLSQAMPA